MNDQKTTPAAAKLACIQCGALYPALPGGSGLCPTCAQTAARTAVCAKCGKPFALPRKGWMPSTCPACRVPKRNRRQGPRGQYFGDKAPAPTSAAKAEQAPPHRRPKGKGPGGVLGAFLPRVDAENARREAAGLPVLTYGQYVQRFDPRRPEPPAAAPQPPAQPPRRWLKPVPPGAGAGPSPCATCGKENKAKCGKKQNCGAWFEWFSQNWPQTKARLLPAPPPEGGNADGTP